MKNKYALPLLLGLAHGLNDCVAGYILGSAGANESAATTGALLLVYNVIAFGGQWPVGMLLDRYGRVKMVSVMSLAVALAALLLFNNNLPFAVLLAGIASAFFHVSGGIIALSHSSGLSASGLFAGPGVAGLVTGGALSHFHFDAVLVIALMIISVIIMIWLSPYNEIEQGSKHNEHEGFDRHDILMIILLLVISLRSACWDIFQLINEGNFVWLGWIAFAAALGKVTGGFVAARIGIKRYLFTALTLSGFLLTFWADQLIALCTGIALLQSTIPVTMSLMLSCMPSRPGSAAGLVLGASIVIGGILFYALKDVPHAREMLFGGMFVLLAVYLLVTRIFSEKEGEPA